MRSVPAQATLDQFRRAQRECTDPAKLSAWLPMLSQYGPDLLVQCESALELSRELVSTWLETYMFKEDTDRKEKGSYISGWLANHKHFKSHGRHLSRERLMKQGLAIGRLELDPKLQDLSLSVFHATTHTFSNTPRHKDSREPRRASLHKVLRTATDPTATDHREAYPQTLTRGVRTGRSAGAGLILRRGGARRVVQAQLLTSLRHRQGGVSIRPAASAAGQARLRHGGAVATQSVYHSHGRQLRTAKVRIVQVSHRSSCCALLAQRSPPYGASRGFVQRGFPHFNTGPTYFSVHSSDSRPSSPSLKFLYLFQKCHDAEDRFSCWRSTGRGDRARRQPLRSRHPVFFVFGELSVGAQSRFDLIAKGCQPSNPSFATSGVRRQHRPHAVKFFVGQIPVNIAEDLLSQIGRVFLHCSPNLQAATR